ncbi:hypothetical protein CBM2586_B90159 [Cupriavidus phytorum]|uniref:Uncharacterized protein n=1 Tax=Cupriavidus taiwanensis TaxID=164546 RepID=A0A976ABZ6_9BURK|nr:hypothetical protein CBM2586_B90159 [Cupriavidus taiwanensis]
MPSAAPHIEHNLAPFAVRWEACRQHRYASTFAVHHMSGTAAMAGVAFRKKPPVPRKFLVS